MPAARALTRSRAMISVMLTAITELAPRRSDMICSLGTVRHPDLAGTSFIIFPNNNSHRKKVVLRRVGIRVADGRDPLAKKTQNDRCGGLPTQRPREPGGDRHSHEVQIEIAARGRRDGGSERERNMAGALLRHQMHRRLAQRFLEIGPGSAISSRLLLHYDRTVVRSAMTLSIEHPHSTSFANRMRGPRPPFSSMSIEVAPGVQQPAFPIRLPSHTPDCRFNVCWNAIDGPQTYTPQA